MNDEVRTIVSDTLEKGAAMRDAQRAYFIWRTQDKLTAAKNAEAAFDDALYHARYAMKYGHPKPIQEVLPL